MIVVLCAGQRVLYPAEVGLRRRKAFAPSNLAGRGQRVLYPAEVGLRRRRKYGLTSWVHLQRVLYPAEVGLRRIVDCFSIRDWRPTTSTLSS